MLLVGIGTLHDELRSRVPVDSKMHLVLHRLEEQAGRPSVLIVIKRRCIQVCDLLIELSFAQPYLPNLLKLPLEVFVREHMPLFQALYVHCPALNGMVFHDLPRPFAELHSTLIIAQETAEDVKLNAKKEMELMLKETEVKSQRMLNEASLKVQKMQQEYDEIKKQAQVFRTRLKTLLDAQLEMLKTADDQDQRP